MEDILDKTTLQELGEYVERHIFAVHSAPYEVKEKMNFSTREAIQPIELEGFIKDNRKPTLSRVLFDFIDEKGYSDSEVYKKAGIDRRHFSKIRSNPDYRIGKNTAMALALALELTRNETDALLNAAGFSLSKSDTKDLVIEFCIERKLYNLHDVNQALDYFNLRPLTELH